LRQNLKQIEMQTTEEKVLTKIKKAKRGALFFADSFVTAGNAKTVNKALERLVKSGEIDRIATGIYVRPKIDNMLGKLYPDIEEIGQAIARRDRAKIIPTGSYALNRLGLSTQVPMNIVYLTDGAARTVKIRKFTIKFKKTTPRNVSAAGSISKLVIQALRTIGKENITDEEIKKILNLLKHEKPTLLEHDIWLAPAWIRDIMKLALTSKTNE
jgi:predicted transcriptional regulator of viral defense system